jgi:glycosyltransferase involved in cell wall biosynthesis
VVLVRIPDVGAPAPEEDCLREPALLVADAAGGGNRLGVRFTLWCHLCRSWRTGRPGKDCERARPGQADGLDDDGPWPSPLAGHSSRSRRLFTSPSWPLRVSGVGLGRYVQPNSPPWSNLTFGFRTDGSDSDKPAAGDRDAGSVLGRRLLVLAPYPPRLDATHGGSRVMAEALSVLASRHRVAVLYLRGRQEPEMESSLRAQCDLVREVPHAHPRAGLGRMARRLRNALAPLAGTPTWAAWFSSKAFADSVRGVAAAWQPDVVQLEYHLMGQYVRALHRCTAPRVLVQHEPGAATHPVRPGDRGLDRVAAYLDLHAWRRYETRIMRQVGAVVVFTEQDRDALAPLAGRTRVVRIPLGVRIPARPLDGVGGEPATLLFVGSFAHPPNADAARRLIDEILPRVRVAHAKAKLVLVGTHPPADLRRRIGGAVELAEAVPDVTPHLSRASVVLAPLRLGGGMRVKVLEALASGKALVASRLAVAGLDVTDGRECVLADSDEEFARAVSRLLGDADRRRELGTHARRWAEAHLSWSSVAEEYERLYDTLLDR